MNLRTLGLTLALILSTPLLVSAQAMDSTDSFSITISPQYPSPNGAITLSPTSGSVDITNAIMTILVNTKQTYQGSAKPVAVTLGAAGTATSIKVSIKSNNQTTAKTFTIRPQEVSLIAEPVSSAPAFYLGKPLVPLEGSVRVVAIANMRGVDGKPISPAALAYTWAVDGTRIISSSGIGKDTFLVASPLQYRERTVSVTIQSQDGTVGSGASLSLSAQEPTIRVYRNDPLLGILYDHALSGSYTIAGAESSLYAAPYSFTNNGGAPILKWFLNGALAQTGNSITLRPTGAGQGGASLSLTASAGQSATKTLNLSLTFGAASSGNSFFGL